MQVQVENEKIFNYMAIKNYSKPALAHECGLSTNQLNGLITKNIVNISPRALIRFCHETGFKFSNLFKIIKYSPREQIGVNVLLNNYDGDDRVCL